MRTMRAAAGEAIINGEVSLTADSANVTETPKRQRTIIEMFRRRVDRVSARVNAADITTVELELPAITHASKHAGAMIMKIP